MVVVLEDLSWQYNYVFGETATELLEMFQVSVLHPKLSSLRTSSILSEFGHSVLELALP